MLPCIQWLHKMHWLCEQDTHTHTIFIHTHTCQRNNADVEGGCSTCAVMADDPKRTQSINPSLLQHTSVFQSGLWGWEETLQLRVPSLAVHDLGLKQNLHVTTTSHTFTIALAKLKTNKVLKKNRYIIAEHTLLTSHFAQQLHKHASLMVKRLRTPIPTQKNS